MGTASSVETEDGSTFNASKVAEVSEGQGDLDARVEPRDFGERFEVVRILGRGGMGVVYEAVDRHRDRHVALKTLAQMSPNGIHRFKSEFRSLAGLTHPHLAQLYELFCEGGWWFFTMELVHGRGLLSALERAPERTLPVFARLAGAIAYLHEQGLVHRDLKPSNVLVTSNGDVRLLDYGLVAPMAARPAGDTLSTHIAGTPAYMAPEQLAGRPGPSSDWFAFGRMLHEALEVVHPVLADATETHSLVERLTDEELERRPSGTEVLGHFPTAPVPDSGATTSVQLVGRDAELDQLMQRWTLVERGGRAQVWIEGSSGIGKSALLAALVDAVGPHAMVLSGRCYQRESVPFNAFDEVVDSAVRELRVLPEAEAAAVLPRGIRHAARIFPALRRVRALERVPEPAHLSDPVALRRHAIAALVSLLATVSDERPILLCIDDLQWGDADSALLWDALARGVPRLFLVGATRDEERAGSAFFNALDSSAVEAIALGPLSDTDAASLLAELQPTLEEASIQRMVRDCRGQPFLLSRVDGDTTVLADRIDALNDTHRAVLNAVAISDGPIPVRVLERVAGRKSLDRELVALTTARLLRAGSQSGVVECYHDRIRETVAASVTDPTGLHERLAHALLEEPDPDPELVAHHLHAAGNPESWVWAERAGDTASAALAPDAAVRWYQTAVSMAPPEARRRVKRKLADALADAGLGGDGAEHLLELATEAEPVEAIHLESLAGLWLLSVGQRPRANALYQRLFDQLGLWLPRGRVGSAVQFAVEGCRLAWRGLEVGDRPDPLEQAKVELLCGWVVGLGYETPMRLPGLYLTAARRALDIGEPVLVARTLCYLTQTLYFPGGWFRYFGARVLHALERHGAAHPIPHVEAMVHAARVLQKIFGGYYGPAADEALHSLAMIESLPLHSVLGDREAIRLFAGIAKWYAGDALEMFEELRGWEADAEARDNRYLPSFYRMTGWHTLTMLGQGRMSEAIEDEERVRQAYCQSMGWEDDSDATGHNSVFGRRLAQLYIRMFRENDLDAHQEAETILDQLWSDELTWTVSWRNHLYYLDGIVQLRLAAMAPDSAAWRVKRVRRLIRRSSREGLVHCDGHAAVLRASLAVFEGDIPDAIAWLQNAQEIYGRAGVRVLVAVLRRARGLLRGGEVGDALVAEADATLQSQGVTELGAFTRFYVYLPAEQVP